MGEGSGVGENVVECGPFALIFVGARSEFGGTVDEVMAASEEFELRGVGFSIEITHDEKVGVLSFCAHRVGVCLQLLAYVHA